jgi:hypothetical protein
MKKPFEKNLEGAVWTLNLLPRQEEQNKMFKKLRNEITTYKQLKVE